ncbi:MAG: MerR family transcriptional regulator [Candidatus Gastranaerophilales bacterium]|nr:MerR family transcriptional regulator [Candidatus Gastranaerophilales bacterium]
MQVDDDLPVYSIGVASQILNLHPRTLRIYEAEGLISTQRSGGKRFYSKNDLIRIECLRKLIHDENISIPGIKKLLEFTPCWKLKDCNPEKRKQCKELNGRKRRCWEFSQRTCEKTCSHCEVFLREK